MSITSHRPHIAAANARQVQQRHILNMMGIECWVGRDAQTLRICDLKLDEHTHSAKQSDKNSATSSIPITDHDHGKKSSPDAAAVVHQAANGATQSVVTNAASASMAKPSQVITQVLNKFKQPAPELSNVESVPATTPMPNVAVEQHIEAFTLLGVGFGDWVLLVDSEQLHQGSTLQLWRNIVASLSLTEQSLSFPICEGMQSVELANASLAGFVFCIAQDDNKQVAALTPLPEGLDHERLVSVPLLSEMLADGRQKRQLWHLLSAASTHGR